jgi:hypothetical protein
MPATTRSQTLQIPRCIQTSQHDPSFNKNHVMTRRFAQSKATNTPIELIYASQNKPTHNHYTRSSS